MSFNDAETEKPDSSEIRELFGTTLPKAISLYTDILKGDSRQFLKTELAHVSVEELQKHLDELSLLDNLLKEFAQNPSEFEVRDTVISKDDQSRRVRIKPRSSSVIGNSPDTAQTQINFYTRIFDTSETRDQVIEAASMQGVAPEQALGKAEKQFSGGEIRINTIGVLRVRSGEVLVIPRAGIGLVKTGEFLDIDGLKPVGTQFHKLAIDNEDDVTLEDYKLLHQTITQMSGNKS